MKSAIQIETRDGMGYIPPIRSRRARRATTARGVKVARHLEGSTLSVAPGGRRMGEDARDKAIDSYAEKVLVSASFLLPNSLPTAFATLPLALSLTPPVTLAAAFFTKPLARFAA